MEIPRNLFFRNSVLIGVAIFGGILCNVFVYEMLRFCERGFSAGKSDVTKVQLTLFKH
jgi:hypothetical protein